jgi:glycosyltransferase involved in cell wall biosynthesis
VDPLIANLLAMLEGFAARFLTARIITVADGEQTLARHFKVGVPKLFVTVHTGIDPDFYDKPNNKAAQKSILNLGENTLLVGAVGRLGEQKSPLDFVYMATLVHKRMPQAHFIWAGSGPLERSARKLSEELGIDKVCHFTGEYKDIPSLLGVMDCFVLPSLWEGFPIVLLEAMATGVPIVATNIPGNDEVITSGKNGWLVPPGDPSALAEKVLGLLNDPGQASLFAEFGRERIRQEFTREKMLDSIQNVYQIVVDETRRK